MTTLSLSTTANIFLVIGAILYGGILIHSTLLKKQAAAAQCNLATIQKHNYPHPLSLDEIQIYSSCGLLQTK